ncbi:MAG: energy transducer TonB [Deltaproteobacteria bacterium]|nr:energy transducer TonB [Deltaproteobacteria bacterium]
MLRSDAKAFRKACVLGVLIHAAIASALIVGASGTREREWRPLAVVDMSRFDPLGGLGGSDDALLREEAAPVPEAVEPEAAEPEPEPDPEEFRAIETSSERVEPLPPPAAAEAPKERPKPKPRAVTAPSRASGPPPGMQGPGAAAPGSGGPGPGGARGGSGVGNPDELDAYKASVRRRLERRKKYPPSAQARRMAGVARVRFTVRKDGTISSSALVESSGHGVLDDEAMALLARSSPLPPIPDGAGLDSLDLTVPLSFSLN